MASTRSVKLRRPARACRALMVSAASRARAERVRPGIGDFGFAQQAALNERGGLELVGTRFAAGAGALARDPGRPVELDLGDIEHDVGREIGGGLVDLVENLLGDRAPSTMPPVPAGLVTMSPPGCFDLGDRITELGQARHVLDARIGEISTRQLSRRIRADDRRACRPRDAASPSNPSLGHAPGGRAPTTDRPPGP